MDPYIWYQNIENRQTSQKKYVADMFQRITLPHFHLENIVDALRSC